MSFNKAIKKSLLPIVLLLFFFLSVWGLNEVQDHPSPLIGQLDGAAPIILLCFIVLLAPVIEEIAFRSWQKSNKIWIAIGGLLMLLYCALNTWLLAFIVLPLFIIALRFYPKPIILSILGSAVFALVHLNLNTISLAALAYGFYFFTMGLIFSYAFFKKGLWLSMLLHALFNLWVTLSVEKTELFFDDQIIKIDTENIQGVLVKQSIFDKDFLSNSTVSNTGVQLNNVTSNGLMHIIFPSNDSVRYVYYSTLNRFSIKLLPKRGVFNEGEWEKSILRHIPYRLDTIAQKQTVVYELLYQPTAAQRALAQEEKEIESGYFNGSIKSLAAFLADHYAASIVSNDTARIIFCLNKLLPFNATKAQLENEYGLIFKKHHNQITSIGVYPN